MTVREHLGIWSYQSGHRVVHQMPFLLHEQHNIGEGALLKSRQL